MSTILGLTFFPLLDVPLDNHLFQARLNLARIFGCWRLDTGGS